VASPLGVGAGAGGAAGAEAVGAGATGLGAGGAGGGALGAGFTAPAGGVAGFRATAFFRGVALAARFFRGAAFASAPALRRAAAPPRAAFLVFAFAADFFLFFFFALSLAWALAFFLAAARPRSISRRAASVPAFTALAAFEAFRAMPRAVRSAALRRVGVFLRSAATFLRIFLAAVSARFFTFAAADDADLASRLAVFEAFFEAFFRRVGAFLRAFAAARLAALPTAPALARTFFAALLALRFTFEAARLRDADLVRALTRATFFFDRAFSDAFFRPPTFVAIERLQGDCDVPYSGLRERYVRVPVARTRRWRPPFEEAMVRERARAPRSGSRGAPSLCRASLGERRFGVILVGPVSAGVSSP
jgi:hypothetical protein